jgi:hypothetical protein
MDVFKMNKYNIKCEKNPGKNNVVTFIGKDKDGKHYKLENPIKDGELVLIERGFPPLHFLCAYEAGIK